MTWSVTHTIALIIKSCNIVVLNESSSLDSLPNEPCVPAVISQLYLASCEILFPKCSLTKNHFAFWENETWSRSTCVQSDLKCRWDILIPFWLIIMWDCTALKMHLTQKMYVICTWDWQQNLTYVWYVAPSTHKSTLTCCYAPPTIYWLKGTRSLTSVYK